jgi:transposase InsO family protein
VSTLEIKSIPTRRNHPETNGKIERMNGTVKNEAIRPNAPQTVLEAWEILSEFEYIYNHQTLHAGIKFLRPSDLFFNRQNEIQVARQQKLHTAKDFRIQENRNSTLT